MRAMNPSRGDRALPPLVDQPQHTLSWLLHRLSRGRLLWMTYPVRVAPRWGHGRPPHERLMTFLDGQRREIAPTLEMILTQRKALQEIPVRAEDGLYWNNPWFTGLDLAALYALIASRAPARYVEVGSGFSTRVVRKAITDTGISTRIRSIDPAPRAECNALCDEIIRAPLAEAGTSLFEDLTDGDVLFFDSSHQAFQNSDVTILFLEVLPKLPPGVLIHIHDIWLPYDYPARWQHWYYNEQYLLAVMLLAAPERYRVLLPSRFVCEDTELSAVLAPLWDDPRLRGCNRHGGSFWFEVRR
jgi:Methyltransferase domain